MKISVARISFFLVMVAVLWVIGCTKDPDPSSETLIKGSIRGQGNDAIIFPAFLIMENKVLATSNENGTYKITSLDPGHYTLVCSALNFSDQIVRVDVDQGKTTPVDILLAPDESKGRVYGEFHDRDLYEENLVSNPAMVDWNDKQLHDGVSGATLQSIAFSYDLPERQVYLGDSLLGIADDFGQYWFDIQSGTYPLTGKCEGYVDSVQIVRIEPDTRVYANYILSVQ